MAKELSEYQHYVIVDEAHVIKMWGPEFRKAYARIGALQSILYNAAFSAVTATATVEVKAAIIECLHLGARRPLEIQNLGNYRKNICYKVHVMDGGLKSYHELFKFVVPVGTGRQVLIFVDDVKQTHAVAYALRKHLGLKGKSAYRIRPYHANLSENAKRKAILAFKAGECDYLAATEALTMGADFDGVERMLQLGAPSSMCTHGQRSGRIGRNSDAKARSVMMITQNQLVLAQKIVKGNKNIVPEDLVKPKREDNDLGEPGAEDGALEDEDRLAEQGQTSGNAKTKSVQKKGHSRTAMDRAFDNPSHESCYENGNCDLCVAWQARDEAEEIVEDHVDVHARERAIKREEDELQIIFETGQPEELKTTKTSSNRRPTEETKRIRTHLLEWRARKLLDESQTHWISLEDIATDKALEAIAKSASIDDVASLDHLVPLWPQRKRWGEEVVSLVKDLLRRLEEESRLEQERVAAAALEQKQARKLAKRVEKQAQKTASEAIQRMEAESREEGARLGKRRATEVARRVESTSGLQQNNTPRSEPVYPPPVTNTPTTSEPSRVVGTSSAKVFVQPNRRPRVVYNTPPQAGPSTQAGPSMQAGPSTQPVQHPITTPQQHYTPTPPSPYAYPGHYLPPNPQFHHPVPQGMWPPPNATPPLYYGYPGPYPTPNSQPPVAWGYPPAASSAKITFDI
ncbi:ATP-dependent DNA helicase sgs1 [Ceratobasidium sp. 395]|nr:ATP-dependent DNA helicase sgs1 [Ceratobasidium sp. 395]